MQRQHFRITLNGEFVTVKHKWNSAIRHIEALARETARQEACSYHLTMSQSTKGVFGHTAGVREWTGPTKVLRFEVSE